MVKKLTLILTIFILLVQLISAVDTEITVKTLPGHKIMISALNPGEGYSLINSFHKDSGPTGEVSIILSSTVNYFDVAVWVKKDNQVILYKKFENGYPSGTPIVLELYPEWYVKEEVNNLSLEENTTISSENISSENITINETAVILEEKTEQQNPSLGGSVIFGEGFFSNNKIYYGIGIIALLAIITIFAIKIKNRSKEPREIKIRKLSDIQAEKKEKFQYAKKIIENAEKKINEAQEEIRSIKNKGKIEEVKNKILEYEQELARLREGKE